MTGLGDMNISLILAAVGSALGTGIAGMAAVGAWKKAFSDCPEVEIKGDDILELAHTSIVSPANSYGFMDGGIDLAYSHYFGPHLQEKVFQAISLRPEGFLPVGASLMVRTENQEIPYLIVAPTMKLPGPVPAGNCYHAMVAILRIASKNEAQLKNVFCPGLATGIGEVPPEAAAGEMAAAYKEWQERTRQQKTESSA